MGAGARVERASVVTDASGYAEGDWVLGIRAGESQELDVRVRVKDHVASMRLRALAIPHIIARLVIGHGGPTTVRLGDSTRLALEAEDPFGNRFEAPQARWFVSDTNVARVDSAGLLLGGPRRGFAVLRASSGDSTVVHIISVVQYVATVRVISDTVRFTSIGDTISLGVTAFDDRGYLVRDSMPTVLVEDTTVIHVAGVDHLVSRGAGQSHVRASLGGVTATVRAEVRQQAVAMTGLPDSVSFDALGDSLVLQPLVLDRRGTPILGAAITATVDSSSIVDVSTGLVVRPRRDGRAVVHLAVDSANAGFAVGVLQTPATIKLDFRASGNLTLARRGDSVAAAVVLDRTGFPLAPSRFAVVLGDSTLRDASEHVLRAERSGRIQIEVSAGALSRVESGWLAVAPEVVVADDPAFGVTTVPESTWAWSPTAVPSPAGGVDLYFSAYSFDSVYQQPRSNLLRASSVDSVSFTVVGVALERDAAVDDWRGQGVENVAIIPRADAAGYRMLVAAGGYSTGWGIASAVSTDAQTWAFESDSFVVPPGPSGGAQRPSGEGISIWHDSSGTWWMASGAFPADTSEPGQWCIALYRSSDQITWTQDRILLRPGPAGSGRERAVYGPSIVEITPGIWRMYFTGDDLNVAGPGTGHSAIWSAVSLDRIDWRVEGFVISSPTHGVFYPSIVGSNLYYLVATGTSTTRLALARIRE
jgi:hypothetical protein